jgi:RNA:NAD 2'-phosphotransferase (TPT1/KptA family)
VKGYKKIQDLITKAEADIKSKHKNLLQSIVTFDNSERFKCKEGAIEPFYKNN